MPLTCPAIPDHPENDIRKTWVLGRKDAGAPHFGLASITSVKSRGRDGKRRRSLQYFIRRWPVAIVYWPPLRLRLPLLAYLSRRSA